MSFPLTTLRELEGSLLPLCQGEGTRRGPGPAARPRTAKPLAAVQRVGRHGNERLQDQARAGALLLEAGPGPPRRLACAQDAGAGPPERSGPRPPARARARDTARRRERPPGAASHSARGLTLVRRAPLGLVLLVLLAHGDGTAGARAEGSREPGRSLATAPRPWLAASLAPRRSPGRAGSRRRGRKWPRPARRRRGERFRVRGRCAARGGFKARAGPAGREAALAARGVRRRSRSDQVPAAPGGRGAMDQAVGDLKQALPCVAEAPAVHVEVLQRGGR